MLKLARQLPKLVETSPILSKLEEEFRENAELQAYMQAWFNEQKQLQAQSTSTRRNHTKSELWAGKFSLGGLIPILAEAKDVGLEKDVVLHLEEVECLKNNIIDAKHIELVVVACLVSRWVWCRWEIQAHPERVADMFVRIMATIVLATIAQTCVQLRRWQALSKSSMPWWRKLHTQYELDDTIKERESVFTHLKCHS
jgi:hypothetical protein